MSTPVFVGAACRPNFSGPGRRRRQQAALVMGVVAVGLWVGLMVAGASWPWRLLVGLPAAGAVISWLQVRRNTCVAHAAAGTVEHDDFSTTQADAEFAAASRRVAATITRDGVLVGATVAVLAALIR